MSGIPYKPEDTLHQQQQPQGNKTSYSKDTYNNNATTATEPTAPRTTATYGEPAYNTGGATTAAPVTENYTYGSTGPAPNTAGPHKYNMMNKADPRVDSDLDNTQNVGSTNTKGPAGHTGTAAGSTGRTTWEDHTTTGPAPKTAGPHKSDMLNKLDPRVDSNLDGSKTVGGNKTFAGSNFED